jgi:hypothetical protein
VKAGKGTACPECAAQYPRLRARSAAAHRVVARQRYYDDCDYSPFYMGTVHYYSDRDYRVFDDDALVEEARPDEAEAMEEFGPEADEFMES